MSVLIHMYLLKRHHLSHHSLFEELTSTIEFEKVISTSLIFGVEVTFSNEDYFRYNLFGVFILTEPNSVCIINLAVLISTYAAVVELADTYV